MRGKKAKMLRKLAREVATERGFPERKLVMEQQHGMEFKPWMRGTAVNLPKSMRGVYQSMKAEYKRRMQG